MPKKHVRINNKIKNFFPEMKDLSILVFWKETPGCLPYTSRISPLPLPYSVGVTPVTPRTFGNISYI